MKAKHHILSRVEKEDKYFRLHMGSEVRSLEELRDSLKTMSRETFEHHVTNDRNDFASWVGDVLKDYSLSAKLNKLKSREAILGEVSRRIHWLDKQLDYKAIANEAYSKAKDFTIGTLKFLENRRETREKIIDHVYNAHKKWSRSCPHADMFCMLKHFLMGAAVGVVIGLFVARIVG